MGEIFGMAGQLGAAAMQADAIEKASETQVKALKEQRDFVFSQLDPTKISGMAKEADIERARSRLALQGSTDPALLAARYAAEGKILEGVEGLGQGPSEAVAGQAAYEALAGGGTSEQMKQRLIDTALDELNAGATLPQDVQAELVRAGLERSGSVSGKATSRGLGGNITREMVGERALALKSERQAKAVALSQAANQLEQSRAQLLQNLFPALKANQLSNISAAQGALASSAAEMPQAGLSGESIANIWMARVGVTNQLAQAQADAAAKNTIGQAQAWSNAIGGVSGAISKGTETGSIPSTKQVGSWMGVW